MKNELVTQTELASIWGVSKQAVSKLFKRAGAPLFVDGKIPRAEAENWRAQRARNPELNKADGITDARRRQENCKAELLELEVLTKRGELIPRAEVEANCREDGARIRAALMAMPSRLAPTLADAALSGGIPAVAAALDADIRRTLEALASLDSLDMET